MTHSLLDGLERILDGASSAGLRFECALVLRTLRLGACQLGSDLAALGLVDGCCKFGTHIDSQAF